MSASGKVYQQSGKDEDYSGDFGKSYPFMEYYCSPDESPDNGSGFCGISCRQFNSFYDLLPAYRVDEKCSYHKCIEHTEFKAEESVLRGKL